MLCQVSLQRMIFRCAFTVDYGHFCIVAALKGRFFESKCSCQRVKPRFVVCVTLRRIKNRYKKMNVIGFLFYICILPAISAERDREFAHGNFRVTQENGGIMTETSI